ncbi:EAL domain-containing protein [Leucothrix sargassi]|nr:EAL domain-containing protein [Leucothrix sargassi]
MGMNKNSAYRLVLLQQELVMVLGSSSDPGEILERFTMRAIKALNLRCVHIIQKENQEFGLEQSNFKLPFLAINTEKHAHLKKYVEADIPEDSAFVEELEIEGSYWYAYSIRNMGFIVFERVAKPFNQSLITALTAPITRLGQIYTDRMQFLMIGKHHADVKNISENLEIEKDKLTRILNAINDAVVVLHDDGRVDFLNPAGSRLLGLDEKATIEGHFTDHFRILDSVTEGDITDEIFDTCKLEGNWFDEKPVIMCIDCKQHLVVRFNVQSMYYGAKGVDSDNRYLVCTFNDITEAHKLEQELKWHVNHDPLTQSYNRRGFEDKMLEIVKGRRKRSSVLISMDLDRFKHVNDLGGHLAGDALLQQVTSIMLQEIRKTDTLARIGGDEFCIILENSPVEKGLDIAERIRTNIDRLRFRWEKNVFTIGISLGVTEIKVEDTNVDEVFLRADEACMASKENGRNQVTLADKSASKRDTGEPSTNYLHCVNRALLNLDDTYQFILYKQAISPTLDKNIKPHQEVLLRISKDGRLIPPNAFLPAAERSGKVSEIDLWVLEKTLGYLRKDKSCTLNVNISGVTLSADNSREKLFKLISDYPSEARYLCLEITETSAITNLYKCIAFMELLNDIGVTFALDDFGTGVSSFSYLKTLPVKYLKIDGSFIRDICTNEIDEIVVQSITSAAKAMKILTVAEYVNTPEVLAKIKELGVDYAQGYYLSEPVALIKAPAMA